MNKIPTLSIRFTNKIRHTEIPLFRGAIIASSNSESILFHNHKEEGFRYSYPLIQYKRVGGAAMIICIGKGSEAIGDFFGNTDFKLRIGDKTEEFKVESVVANETIFQIWDSTFNYRLVNWLPLNQRNYQIYNTLESLADRCTFLEKILVGNILSLAKGLNLQIDKELTCKITEISDFHIIRYKNTKMMAFNIKFKSNISLPQYLGLGKGVSIGYGTTTKINTIEKMKSYNNYD